MVKEKTLQELFVVENCPFCNSKIIAPTKLENSNFIILKCEECMATGPLCASLEEAVIKWNKYKTPQQKIIEKYKIPEDFVTESCSFCGSRNLTYTNEHDKTKFKGFNGFIDFRLICENCGASGPVCKTLLVAVEKWNAQQAKQQETIDDLKRQLCNIENILGEALYGRDTDNMPLWKPEPIAVTLAKEFAWRNNNKIY